MPSRPFLGRVAAAFLVLIAAVPAGAQELPHFPKAGPPEPLPEASCDTAQPSNGDWLLGHWVAPQTRFEFARKGAGIGWVMDRKAEADDFGWRQGGVIEGKVAEITGCTVRLTAGDDDFVFEGVLTGEGKLYGYAVNKAGRNVRFLLRREK
ncbi:MAG: hypothetical protein M0006_11095 [Magnetospirillum sp.]|nr:hypothetical protein [Magnetospirillum sp.]